MIVNCISEFIQINNENIIIVITYVVINNVILYFVLFICVK